MSFHSLQCCALCCVQQAQQAEQKLHEKLWECQQKLRLVCQDRDALQSQLDTVHVAPNSRQNSIPDNHTSSANGMDHVDKSAVGITDHTFHLAASDSALSDALDLQPTLSSSSVWHTNVGDDSPSAGSIAHAASATLLRSQGSNSWQPGPVSAHTVERLRRTVDRLQQVG